MRRLSLCVLGLLAGMLVAVPTTGPAAASPSRASDRQVGFARWEGGPAFQTGSRSGTRLKHGVLVLKAPGKQRRYRGTRYDVGTWTSAPVAPGFAITQLVASWAAGTPRNSWVEVRVRLTGVEVRQVHVVERLRQHRPSEQIREYGTGPAGRSRPVEF